MQKKSWMKIWMGEYNAFSIVGIKVKSAEDILLSI